jgi:hypothetical protein
MNLETMNLELLDLKLKTCQKLLQIYNNKYYKYQYVDAIKKELENLTVTSNKEIVTIICDMLISNDISYNIISFDGLVHNIILSNNEGCDFCRKLIGKY